MTTSNDIITVVEEKEETNDIFVRMQQDRTHHHPNFYQHHSLLPSSSLTSPHDTTTSTTTNDHDDSTTTTNTAATKTKQEKNNDDDENENNVNDTKTSNNQDTTTNDINNININNNDTFTFIVMADTQFGMINSDEHWDEEIKNCQYAIEKINSMSPRPLFCCICGDLINMTSSIYKGTTKPQWWEIQQKKQKKQKHDKTDSDNKDDNTDNNDNNNYWTEDECDDIQLKQCNDFKKIWSKLHSDIALVCICGNHDVGNRPTPHSIQQYTNQFGNDYLSFYVGNPISLFIVLNTSLFNDNTNALQQYNEQLIWLDKQLYDARNHNNNQIKYIFILAHHPLFIYNENEDYNDLINGVNICGNDQIPDGYFHIPKKNRQVLLNMFSKYNVTAYFSGHYHQNMISRAISFNMEMIITSSISSIVLQSNGPAKNHTEPKSLGYRIVNVNPNTYQHHFVSLYE